MINISERIKEERLRFGLNQADFGALGGVTKLSQFNYETGKRAPTADYLGHLIQKGVDIQYIFTGVRSENLPTFESKLDRLSALTARFQAIADGRKQQADPYQLGPVRDFAFQNGLTDAQIEALFDLLELSGVEGFWLEGCDD